MPEEDHGGIDHQTVGQRVGDLAKGRLDFPAPREPAVDLVGDARDAEDDRGRPAVAAVRSEDETDEGGNEKEPEDSQRVGDLRHAGRIRGWRRPSRSRASSTPTATRFSGPCAVARRARTSGAGASPCWT